MKELFANADIGMIGLLFFFSFFLLMLLWLYRPGSEGKFIAYGSIPLKDGNDE